MNPDPLSLEITRRFSAPRDRVFAAWTDPAITAIWWCPDGCTTLESTADLRVGGKYRFRIQVPDGDITASGEYRDIRPPESVVQTWQWDDDAEWENHSSLITASLTVENNGTVLRLRHENFPSEDACENHCGGWNAALDRLQTLLAA